MILNIERKQLPHDVVVFEMTGRIILGNNSRDVELNLTKALNENARKVIFDLTGVALLASTIPEDPATRSSPPTFLSLA